MFTIKQLSIHIRKKSVKSDSVILLECTQAISQIQGQEHITDLQKKTIRENKPTINPIFI